MPKMVTATVNKVEYRFNDSQGKEQTIITAGEIGERAIKAELAKHGVTIFSASLSMDVKKERYEMPVEDFIKAASKVEETNEIQEGK